MSSVFAMTMTDMTSSDLPSRAQLYADLSGKTAAQLEDIAYRNISYHPDAPPALIEWMELKRQIAFALLEAMSAASLSDDDFRA